MREAAMYLNGAWLPASEGRVSLLDYGYQFGDGVFDTLRAYPGGWFRFADHWERLSRGAAYLGLALPVDGEGLAGLLREGLAKNGWSQGLARVTLTRGQGAPGLRPDTCAEPTLSIVFRPAPPPVAGLSLLLTDHRSMGTVLPSFVKPVSFLPHSLAKREAAAAGCDEAVLVNSAGRLAEGAISNLFWWEGETLCTPALAEGALDGVTRRVVLELAQAAGIENREVAAEPGALLAADGIFLTNTGWGIAPVSRLGERPLASHPATERLKGCWSAYVRETRWT